MPSVITRWLGGTTLVLLQVPFLAWAEPAAEVEFSRGAAVAQSTGKLPRTMGKGLKLNEGDRITTAEEAVAIVKFNDGTRLTLRPNSEMIVQTYRYDSKAKEENMVLQLLRGGFRAITGLISKNSPNAAKVQTVTATVGIRGTDFDARVCAADCRSEAAKVQEKPLPNTVVASAKIVEISGSIEAEDEHGKKRSLFSGGSIYPGEAVQSGPGAKAVLAFRDESRLTLGANTRFKMDSFVFDAKVPSEGRFLVTLVRGTMRALTGLIGKASARNVSFSTPTATVGIRGTGLDMDCMVVTACNIFTWQGSIEVRPQSGAEPQVLQAGQGLSVGQDGMRPLNAPTLENLPRPDTVPVNMQQLFSSGGISPDEEGLYVYVREGNIQITSANEVLDLGRGETGYAGADGRTGRPADMPLFIQFDPVPMPNSTNPAVVSVLRELVSRSSNMCR